LEASISSKSSFTPNTLDWAQAIAANNAVAKEINNQMSSQSAILVAPVPPGTPPAAFARLYTSKVGHAASLAAATNVRSYVGRIGLNLARSS
jgi:hypothetical protein